MRRGILSVISMTLVAACAKSVPFSSDEPIRIVGSPRAPAQGKASSGPNPIARCENIRATEPFEPKRPMPGVLSYTDHPRDFSRFEVVLDRILVREERLLIAAKDGSARRIDLNKRARLERFAGAGTSTSSLFLLAAHDDGCMPPGVHAVDPVTFAHRYSYEPDFVWESRHSTERPNPRFDVRGFEAGGRVVLEFGVPGGWRLVALDAKTGTPLWKSAVLADDHAAIRSIARTPIDSLSSESILVSRPMGRFSAFRASDGTPWVKDAMGLLAVASKYRAEVVARSPDGTRACPEFTETGCPKYVAVTRAGAAAPSYFPLDNDDAFMPAPDELYVERTSGGSDAFSQSLVAYTPTLNKIRWLTQPMSCAGGPPDDLHFAGDVIDACTCDGTMRRFERKTGRELGSFGIGECASKFRVVGGFIATVMPSFDPESENGYKLGLISTSALRSPLLSVRISGTASYDGDFGPLDPKRGQRRVRVGSHVVRMQPDGSFEAKLESRGIVSVKVATHGESLDATTVFVRLDEPQRSVGLYYGKPKD